MPSTTLECSHRRKCVAFCAEGSEEVHFADEWDRSPTEPARKLPYQDVLELKEIQRSLPRVNQLPDPLSRKFLSQFLSAVPIGLLPLLPESDSGSKDSSNSPSPVTPSSPISSSPCLPGLGPGLLFPMGFPSPQPPTPPTPPRHLSHLSHLLPARPVPVRPKPKFSFLPLLETPPSSTSSSPYPSTPSSPDLHDQDPPTPSLTNASLDSSPLSRASSTSPEPPFFQLPPPRKRQLSTDPHGQNSYFPPFPGHSDSHSVNIHGDEAPSDSHPHLVPSALKALKLAALASPSLLPPSPLSLSTSPSPRNGSPQSPHSSPNLLGSVKPLRRRNFIVVNDVEIEIDEEDEAPPTPACEPEPEPPLTPQHSSPPPHGSSLQLSPLPPPILISVPTPPLPSLSSSSPHLSPTRSPSPPSAKQEPYFAFEREGEREWHSAPSPTSRATPTKAIHSPMRIHCIRGDRERERDFQPPSPILTPYCVPMRRRTSPCSSPVLVPSV